MGLVPPKKNCYILLIFCPSKYSNTHTHTHHDIIKINEANAFGTVTRAQKESRNRTRQCHGLGLGAMFLVALICKIASL